MNNPNDIPIDTEDQRKWLMEHKLSTGLSWNDLAKPIGIKTSTLSLFGTGNFKGDLKRIGDAIFRYRQTLVAQAQLRIEAPDIPGYFETRTSMELMNLLKWAHRGRLTLCAGGPGIGKTTTAREYRERANNVWLVTMRPSTGTPAALAQALLAAMGDWSNPGRSGRASTLVASRLKGSQGLIIIDDAQHCSVDQLEELRSWYDDSGVGVALLGNETVIGRMEGGSRRAEFAQLYSRIGMRMIRPLPLADDSEQLAMEWGIEDDKLIGFIGHIAGKPGGLRGCTFMLEVASMIARSQNEPLSLIHLQNAWSQLTSRPVAA